MLAIKFFKITYHKYSRSTEVSEIGGTGYEGVDSTTMTFLMK